MTEQNTTESNESIIGKLSIANMKCNPARAKAENKTIPLARIIGIVNSCRAKENKQSGDIHYPLIGQFEGTNLETGEVFTSGILYLPAGIHEQVSSHFLTALERGEKAEPVEFAIEIASTPAKNPIGYSYAVKQLYKPASADPLAKLRELSGGKITAIADHTAKTAKKSA